MKSIIKISPLLLLYLLVIFFFVQTDYHYDEKGYVLFAKNLTQGFYSPKDSVSLWFGPGYPLVLAPFMYCKTSLLFPKLLNAIVVFVGIVFFYLSLALYTSEKKAVFFAYILGLYPPLFRYLPFLMSESFTFF